MERDGEGETEQNYSSPVVCNLFMSVTYSTDTDIKTVVKRCCDVCMTDCRSFSGQLSAVMDAAGAAW